MSGTVLWRAVWLFVLLDVVTFILVDWIALPTIGPRLGDLPVPVIQTVVWVVTGLRILLIGFLVARSIENRLAPVHRREAVAAVGIGAGVAALLGIVVSVVTATIFSVDQASMLNLAGMLLLWIAAGTSGALLARPGPTGVPARTRRGAGS